MNYYCELDKRDIQRAIANFKNCDEKDVKVIVEHVTVHSSNERIEHSVKARVKMHFPEQR